MRKVFLFMMVSLDGFFEGPNHELDWHNVDEEFNEFAADQLDEVDVLLFGRKTYELMAGYWPTRSAKENDPVIAEKMNNLPKIVFSRTLEKVTWNNSRLVKENIAEEITKIKQQPGKDLAIFGSSGLSISLIQLGLIDEFRIMVNPVILGKGNPLFGGIAHKLNLELLRTKTFSSGNVLLYYRPTLLNLHSMTTITDEFMKQMLPKSKQYVLCILKAGPGRDQPGVEKIIWEHGRRNFQLRADGILSIVCPVTDENDIRGIGIFNAGLGEVKKIMDDDPGVRSRCFIYELHPCRSFPGDSLK